MPTYTLLLYTHVICVVISISFFTIRGVWMVTENPLLNHKLVLVAPHIVDTLLLASAIGLTLIINQYPFQTDWMTVKLFALVAYIILGTIALKRGKTRNIRYLAFAAAILTFGFIVSVALVHHPFGLLGVLFTDRYSASFLL